MPENTGSPWDERRYHGRFSRYPFTEVVSFVMGRYGSAPDRSRVRILDLGFGGAHHLLFLAQEGFDFYGIDGANESLRIAQERLTADGFPTDTISVGTFDALPYVDDFFDCVIDRGSFTCNVLADLPPLIAEARRVLKPGGALFSMILHETNTSKDSARSLGNNDYTEFEGRLEDAGVLHFTNAEEAADLFSQFEIEDIESILRRSEYAPARNGTVSGWTVVTCRK